MKRLFTLMAIMFTAVTLFAQVTTSSMSGKITNKSGETLPGATISATHTPSGTVYGAVCNSEGRYTIQGMRVGGPYTVEVRFVGYSSIRQDGITLKLGDTYQSNFEMREDSELLEAVEITADASKPVRNSTTTTVSADEISLLPSASRSITDVTKVSPYANGMNFAGSDGRSTNFTVDGANFNNNFGLSSKLPGGGNPISVDAIEEVQVVVAPFDVRQSNFVGGGINAITKSGTNRFSGSAYFYYTNQNLRGHWIDGEDVGDSKYTKRIYGATLGGPIIKNKLFFFANFEKQDEPKQEIIYRPDGESAAQLDLIKNKLQNDYGYDPGSYNDYPGGINNLKVLARLDWNIHRDHKLTFRFNMSNNKEWFAPNGNSCDDKFRNRNYNRSSATSFPFSYNMYSQKNNTMSFAGEYNGRLSENVSNQFIVTYTNNDDKRGSDSKDFPHIDVMTGDLSTGNYVPFTSFGYELFTYNYGVTNNVINATDNVTIYKGNHKITAGANWERQTATNSYMRNGTGYYRFASVEDFLEGNRPLSFCLTYGNNDEKDPRGEITYNQIGVYAQDDWYINDKFKLNYGLRLEGMLYNNAQLMTNNAILNYDMGGKSVNTGKWPNTSVQVSPRIGFNWDILGNNSLTMRGGTGFFQGRLPLVFFTNMPQNAGMIQTLMSHSGKLVDGELVYDDNVAAALDALMAGGMAVDVNDMINRLGINTTVTPEDGQLTSTINGVDQNFKMPQIWKTLLALDYNVPTSFPLTFTLEGMFNKTIKGVRLVDWNLNNELIENATDAQRFNGPDNRVNYNSFTDGYQYGKSDAYVLTNTNKGYGYVVNFSMNMQPAKRLNLMASYTYTESKEVSGMPGSNASSGYSGLYTIDGPTFAGVQRSQYVIPHKVSANLTYQLPRHIAFGDGIKLGVYFTAYSAGAYSYVYSNDMNGDGISTDLMYIPNTASELKFKTDADRDAFQAFLDQDKYLSKHKGQYAEANAARSPWISFLDLRVSEDFAFKTGKTVHHFEVSVNVDNFLNIFDSRLGVYKYGCYGSTSTVSPLKFEGVDENNTPIYSMNKVKDADGNMVYPTKTFDKYYTGSTDRCWSILLGIKYKF